MTLGVPALFAALTLSFACGSSDSDDAQAGAGAGGPGGTSSAGSVGGAGKAGMSSGTADPAGEAGLLVSAAGAANNGTAGEGGSVAGAPTELAGAGGVTVDDPPVLQLTGAITLVHDPSIVKDGDTFYLFSTGQGVQVRTSKDLKAWKGAGQVFASKPTWITTTDPSDQNNLWAPEVRFFGGTFHLYYAASKFGSKISCIGHATKASLASSAGWADQGAAFCSNTTAEAQEYNALDPDPFEDADGKLWLAFGSFWSGLKLFRLDDEGRRNGPDFFDLATRANTAVEAPYLMHHGDFYYLFESVDSCCQGVNSTYKIMVGRATTVSGPYVDKDGMKLTDGGGTLILQGAGRWHGPGHNAIIQDGARYFNVYHSYDGDNNGVPTLRISELTFDADDWPVSAGP